MDKNSNKVRSLIEKLDSGNWSTRWKAIRELGDIESAEAIQHISKFLHDPDPDIKFASEEALLKIGTEEALKLVDEQKEKDIDKHRKRLLSKETSIELRLESLDFVYDRKTDDLLSLIKVCIKDPNDMLQRRASKYLSNIDPKFKPKPRKVQTMDECDICHKEKHNITKMYTIHTGLSRVVGSEDLGTEIKTTYRYSNFREHDYWVCISCLVKHNFLIHLFVIPFILLWVFSFLTQGNWIDDWTSDKAGNISLEILTQIYRFLGHAFEISGTKGENVTRIIWILVQIFVGISCIMATYVCFKASRGILGSIISVLLIWGIYTLLWVPPYPLDLISPDSNLRALRIWMQILLSVGIVMIIYMAYGTITYNLSDKAVSERGGGDTNEKYAAWTPGHFKLLNK